MAIIRTTVFQLPNASPFVENLTLADYEYLDNYPGRSLTKHYNRENRTWTVNARFDSQEVMEQFDADETVAEIVERASEFYRENNITRSISISEE
jgi:hypothetical protein